MIYTDDRPGILNQLTSILFSESSNIRSLEARGDQARTDDSAIVDVTIDIRDKKQLERVISAFRRIPGVRDIERVQQTPVSNSYDRAVFIDSNGTRTHRHFEIERRQDRLAGSASQRLYFGLFPR